MSDFVRLQMGSALVMRLLPQRPPFLMVDRLDAFAPGPTPAARCSRFLSANEPFFAGHFPDLPMMPGALLMEGAGQTASLAYTMQAIAELYAGRGRTMEDLAADLANLDRGYTLQPGYRPDEGALVLQAFERASGQPIGVAGSVRLKFLRPVPPGCRLVYEARLTHRIGDEARFSVSATVDEVPVLEGSLAAALVHGVPMPGRR